MASGLSGDCLAAFERAIVATVRLDSTVLSIGAGVRGALVARHALLSCGGNEHTARALILGDGEPITSNESAAAPLDLVTQLDEAGLSAGLTDAVRSALDEISSREHRRTASILNAAESAGHLVATAPASQEFQRAAALAAALCLHRGGLVSAPFISVWQLDAAARSAAVQINRSQSWEEWMRAWCLLLAREADATHSTVTDTVRRFESERGSVRDQARTGATDDAVLGWLHDNVRFTIRDAAAGLGLTTPTVGTAIARLEQAGLATELTDQRRDRVWTSTALVQLALTG